MKTINLNSGWLIFFVALIFMLPYSAEAQRMNHNSGSYFK